MGELRKRGVQSKIEKYDLVGHAINLLTVTPKMSYKDIAEELNAIGDVPDDDLVSVQNVSDFANNYPEVRKEILLANRQHMRKMVMESAEFDMLGSLKDMAGRLVFMIDTMESMALEQGAIPDPKGYKALNSELRETLKQIEGIHKEVYDMEIVREFLIEVIKTLKEVSPEALQAFIAKMKGKRENSHIVSELLKGGIQ
ncbi:hypothetical protein MOD67_13960 [Bacillus licheniformis]|nr:MULTISPECIES: hypothetical protein [Bacillus]MCP8973155.1 hypothetical protein [Bacillus licheniformis]MCY7861126.1 hypothetical protein [Bacillus haynesii]MCY8291544.1 hypothetical protein [Bacillus haynesii]MCY8549168.1 hypothetical protein [Bacillus haynesii]MCY8745084.1 hypothetical protein [Bacillus licheniformis]